MKCFRRASLCKLVTVEFSPGGSNNKLRDINLSLPSEILPLEVASCVELLIAVREIESETSTDVLSSLALSGLGSGAASAVSSISAYRRGEGDRERLDGVLLTSAVAVTGVITGAAVRDASEISVAISSAAVRSAILD